MKTTFKNKLQEHCDTDIAMFHLGVSLGLWSGDDFQKVKGVFWTTNPLGTALYDMLDALSSEGILAKDEDGFQWVRSCSSVVRAGDSKSL